MTLISNELAQKLASDTMDDETIKVLASELFGAGKTPENITKSEALVELIKSKLPLEYRADTFAASSVLLEIMKKLAITRQ
ncbi:MAG: hypothetical protein ABL907_18710 [Hyphomicrobium sp.]